MYCTHIKICHNLICHNLIRLLRLRNPGLSITLYVIQEEKVNSITAYLLQASRVLKRYRDNQKEANIEIL